MTEQEVVSRLKKMEIYTHIGEVDSDGLFTLDLQKNSHLSDLSVLKGIPIKELHMYQSPVFGLSPVRDMPKLKKLTFNRTLVTDVSPLEGLDLEFITFDAQFITNGLASLRKMKSLKIINGPAEAFWRHYDAGQWPTQRKERSLGKYPSLGNYLMHVVESEKKLEDQSAKELHRSLSQMMSLQRGYSTTNMGKSFYRTRDGVQLVE